MLLLIIAILCSIALAGTVLWQQSTIRTLQGAVREKAAAVERNAKLLIDKNIELLDQHVAEQRLMQSRDDFIAIVSHQLRTPVTEIKWGLAGLFDGKGAYKPPEREYAEHLVASSARLERLIDTLLRFVSAEEVRGVTSSEPYHPDQLIERTAASTAKNFEKKHIRLDLQLNFGDTIISMDQSSLDMIVANLIENAYYYTHDGGHITVGSTREKDGALTVAVQDTGIGISKGRQSFIFSKFNRTPEAVAAHAEGSGLGLYTVKRVLERYEGIIAFESAEGKGSTFHFTLPARGVR